MMGGTAPGSNDRSQTVLTEDGLDLLELALRGALPPSSPVPWPADTTLTDAENTPLARCGSDGALVPMQPFARGSGPQWSQDLRLAPGEASVRIGEPHPASAPAGLVADALPTKDDVHTLEEAAGIGAPIPLVIAVARRPPVNGRPGAAAIVRAWMAVLAGLPAATGHLVIPVVVPWPGPTAGDFGKVLARYGIGSAVRVDARRGPDERQRLAILETVWEEAARTVYPEASVVELLRVGRGQAQRGAVVFFTGLSGSGKSTIAKALAEDLEASSGRLVTLLDGDEVRQRLSRDLGYDAVGRVLNIERIAWVAATIAATGAVVIAAPIAPFAAGRTDARAMAAARGAAFVLVWVSTPLEVCEARDRKGMYRRARAGEISEFTGITSPYESPDDAEVVVDTSAVAVAAAVARVRTVLEEQMRG